MLAPTFMRADQLQIHKDERDATIRVLGLLERKELVHVPSEWHYRNITAKKGFNMKRLGLRKPLDRCEVGCIGYWVGREMGLTGASAALFVQSTSPSYSPMPHPFYDLFYGVTSNSVTVAAAADATRNFLTLGQSCWPDVLDSHDIVGID